MLVQEGYVAFALVTEVWNLLTFNSHIGLKRNASCCTDFA